MKSFKKLVIFYTIFMLAVLAVIFLYGRGLTLSAENVASYDAQELKIYKQVWDQANLSSRKTVMRCFRLDVCSGA